MSPHRGGIGRRARRLCATAMVTGLTGAAAVIATGVPPASAAGLAIELNKAEDEGNACLASFVIRNGLGHTLDRFSMDVIVFDRDGVIAGRSIVDLAPLPGAKTTVVIFPLQNGDCGAIDRVLVNGFPSCRADDGQTVDCLAGLSVSSRADIGLEK